MALQLERAGLHEVVIFEKNDGVGGTWRENTYPGAGCDVPSYLYSFSFAPKRDWTRRYARQPEILAYAEELADRGGLRSRIRFGTEIVAARFDEVTRRWTLSAAGGEEYEADVVVMACGQLNRPHIPQIPGLHDFGGVYFHSARWDHSVDLAGKRVAVVGNGASAIQFVPRIAPQVAHLTVFQHSAAYVIPKHDRHYGPLARFLLGRVPPAERLYRWWTYWRHEVTWLTFIQGPLASRLADAYRSVVTRKVVSERLEPAAVVPDYPIGCKRLLLASDYYPALSRPNVTVVTSPITGFDTEGLLTADAHHEADVVIFGTGFEATRFLGPMKVTGADGTDLAVAWKDGAEAYLGIAVPRFPNLFLLYGPNTNLVHNSILFMIERQVDYVMQCITSILRGDRPSVEVRADALERFNRSAERQMARTPWVAACHSWYKTATGRVTNNWPSFTVSYWRETLRPRWADFVSPSTADSPRSGTGVGLQQR